MPPGFSFKTSQSLGTVSCCPHGRVKLVRLPCLGSTRQHQFMAPRSVSRSRSEDCAPHTSSAHPILTLFPESPLSGIQEQHKSLLAY